MLFWLDWGERRRACMLRIRRAMGWQRRLHLTLCVTYKLRKLTNIRNH